MDGEFFNLSILMLNIQGLTKTKKYKLEKLITKQENTCSTITLLSETHMKEDKFNWDKRWKVYEKRRAKDDKKGGGLMMIQSTLKTTLMEERTTVSSDILMTEGSISSTKLIIIMVYMATGNTAESIERNRIIKNELEKILDENREDKGIILLGDFNGHIGTVGNQKENRNGRLVKQLAEFHNLTILNLHDKCEGEATWSRNNLSSTIDFVLINEKMNNAFTGMNIDENQERCDLSDHNLIEVNFRWNTRINWNKEQERLQNLYYKTDRHRYLKILIRDKI